MKRLVFALFISACVLFAWSCDKKAPEPEREPRPTRPATDEAPDPPDPKKQAFTDALKQHQGDPWQMPLRDVPGWFFRPNEALREYIPDGELQQWEAQFDCSGDKIPACNLHYEVDIQRESEPDEVLGAAARLTELGFQLVEDRAPSLKAIRPVEHSNAVEVVYVNQSPEMRTVEMIAVLREPVEPTVTSLLAQPRFGPVTDFAVAVVTVPNSINVEKARYEETIAYSVMFDLPEGKRSDVEGYLEDVGFDLVRRGEAEASTSKWRHPSGWKASLEGDDSVYKRFLIYFTLYETPDPSADE